MDSLLDNPGPKPLTAVVMGIGGCGKSTIGRLVAQAWGAQFFDGDEFHSAESIAKMSSGVSLDDDDRRPWLGRLRELARAQRQRTVIACSALKREYRDLLGAAEPLTFIHLSVDEPAIRLRFEHRDDHFFPATLIRSQFETLEPLQHDESGVTVDGTRSPEILVEEICAFLAGAEQLGDIR